MSSNGVNKKMTVLPNKRILELENIALRAGLLVETLKVHFELTTEPAEQWGLVGEQVHAR